MAKRTRPDNCIECSFPLRARVDTHIKASEARQHGGFGLCINCYNGIKRGKGRKNLPVDSDPGKCQYCQRQMRRKRQKKSDYPNSISVGKRGVCVSCLNSYNQYGLTPDNWHTMLISQSGRCFCCGDPMRIPYVDHDHNTGKVRAMLCWACNMCEGALQGDPERAYRLAEYMIRNLNIF